tara:strand:+ start:1588 stop:2058 length:471 start_codon:yes stop_codon:yes gene_type:complete
MSVYTNRVGLRNVGSYQVSGTPFITGAAGSTYGIDDGKVHMVEFPFVSKSVTVINPNTTSGQDLRVHFQSGSGVTAITVPGQAGEQNIAATADVLKQYHYITVPAGNGSVTLDVKCSKFYISNRSGSDNLSYEVFAELTQIPTANMYHLTGSGITE